MSYVSNKYNEILDDLEIHDEFCDLDSISQLDILITAESLLDVHLNDDKFHKLKSHGAVIKYIENEWKRVYTD